MLKLLKKRSQLSQFLVWLAVTALIFGLLGNIQNNFEKVAGEKISTERSVKVLLESIPPTFRIFRPSLKGSPGESNWFLTIGNTAGSIVSFAAIFALLWTVLSEQFEKLKIFRLRNHVVVYGFDRLSRTFLKINSKGAKQKTVTIDPDGSQKTREKIKAAGSLYFPLNAGACFDKLLSACSIEDAQKLLVSTGNDADNLSVLKEMCEAPALRNSLVNEIIVCLEDEHLVERLEKRDEFMLQLGAGKRIRLFNYARACAIQLIQRTPFVEQALGSGHERVSLIIIGSSSVAIECAIQFLKISPIIGLGKPRIDWVVDDLEVFTSALENRCQALAKLVRHSLAKPRPRGTITLQWALSICVHTMPENSKTLAEPLLQNLNKVLNNQTTAILIVQDDLDLNIPMALAVRETTSQKELLLAPIYVHSPRQSSLDFFLRALVVDAENAIPKYLKNLAPTNSRLEVIEPFGRSEAICEWNETNSPREELAKKIHAAYVSKRLSEEDTSSANKERKASLNDWESLSETYRNANRRAADHAVVKFLSIDANSNPRTGAAKSISPAMLEALAKTEHDAWWIDRELDGWEHAKIRDNKKKHHPDLISYEKLTEEIKDYDRVQVKFLVELRDLE